MKLQKFDKAVLGFITALESQDDKARFCEDKAQSLRAAYPNLNTLKTYFSRYRKALKENGFANLLDFFALEIEQSEKLRGAYINRVQLRTEKGETIKVTAKQANQFIAICEDLARQAKPLNVALGLLGLTGRRTVEVLATAEFKQWANEPTIIFSGQAKKGEKAADPYKIHVLSKPKLIVESLNYVRQNLDFEDNEDVNSKTAKALERLIQKHFEGIPVTTAHDFRKLYIAICYKLHGGKQSFRTFAASMLGHESTGEGITTETYMKYKII